MYVLLWLVVGLVFGLVKFVLSLYIVYCGVCLLWLFVCLVLHCLGGVVMWLAFFEFVVFVFVCLCWLCVWARPVGRARFRR